MKYLKFLILFTLLSFTADKPAYQVFTQKGKAVSYTHALKDIQQADIILFGELHNNPIAHWLELQITKDLYAVKKDQLVLGAEMFEADNQLIVNEYIAGKIAARHLESEAKLWDNYDTDYKPLIDFALANHLPFAATNIPRRYASLVARSGLSALDSLSAEARNWMAPLPVQVDLNLPGYKQMMGMGGGSAGHGSEMNASNIARAQAVKDATMAHFILQHWQPGKTFLHFNGSYHSDRFEGIVWYLNHYKPGLKIVTLSSVEQPEIDKLQDKSADLANFIIAIPSDMTKTY
ncbi:ChaN family lipoprotein [Rhodocytophaga rosea]|uniref:ChaN family lipoprotein n=1 Tax=Rhodocytophaga rosea TaxID=2704465 RepID=A0A6C0GRA5_9BACT|nr:ChaN family lipoprotein [Rhodocytophaga rosea]QHT70596.1 ChaN family lipoprotein [Rhodocytophaga rosea]